MMVLPCTEAATIGSLTHCFRRRSLQGTSLDEQVKMNSDHSAHELVSSWQAETLVKICLKSEIIQA